MNAVLLRLRAHAGRTRPRRMLRADVSCVGAKESEALVGVNVNGIKRELKGKEEV